MAREQRPATDSSPESAASRYRQIRFAPPAGSTELLLVRHGESEPADPDRPFPLVDGRGDPELSGSGLEQAELVADRLGFYARRRHLRHKPAAPAQTAAPLAARLGLVPVVEPELAEVLSWLMGEGGIYGRRISEGDPLASQIFEQERWDVIPGAETNESVRTRVTAAINRVADRNVGGRVVCFAHGGTIGAVLAVATGSRPFAFIGSDNAAISTIVVAGPRWLLRGFNDRSHLE